MSSNFHLPVVLVLLLVAVVCLPSMATKNSTESIASYANYLQIPGGKASRVGDLHELPRGRFQEFPARLP